MLAHAVQRLIDHNDTLPQDLPFSDEEFQSADEDPTRESSGEYLDAVDRTSQRSVRACACERDSVTDAALTRHHIECTYGRTRPAHSTRARPHAIPTNASSGHTTVQPYQLCGRTNDKTDV